MRQNHWMLVFCFFSQMGYDYETIKAKDESEEKKKIQSLVFPSGIGYETPRGKSSNFLIEDIQLILAE